MMFRGFASIGFFGMAVIWAPKAVAEGQGLAMPLVWTCTMVASALCADATLEVLNDAEKITPTDKDWDR